MKLALCCGINDYPGTYNDLYGCVDDAKNWSNILYENFGFDRTDLLLNEQATRGNIKAKFLSMLSGAKSGDILVFTYSGHGTNVPDTLDPDEADGYDEALYTYDGVLLDDELRDMIKRLPNDVQLIFISDSCFSGTITRGDLTTKRMNRSRSRKQVTKYMPHQHEGFARRVHKLKRRKRFLIEEDMKEVVFTGCSDQEYSYDAYIDGKWGGAFSHFAVKTLKDEYTYNEWYAEIRKYLPSNNYPQTPQLEGSSANKELCVFAEIEPESSGSSVSSASSESSGSSESSESSASPEPPQISFWQWFINWISSWFK